MFGTGWVSRRRLGLGSGTGVQYSLRHGKANLEMSLPDDMDAILARRNLTGLQILQTLTMAAGQSNEPMTGTLKVFESCFKPHTYFHLHSCPRPLPSFRPYLGPYIRPYLRPYLRPCRLYHGPRCSLCSAQLSIV